MNKYQSKLHVFRARNVVVGAVAPPADFLITSALNTLQLLQPHGPIAGFYTNSCNVNGNFCVRQVAVVSNFADGLVFKDDRYRLCVLLRANAYTRAAADLTGTMTFDPTTKNVVGLGTAFAAELFAGDVITWNTAAYQEYGIVDSITNPLLLTLRDYPHLNFGAASARRLATTPGTTYQQAMVYDISELNYFHDCDIFFNPAAYSTAAATDLILTATFLQVGSPARDIPFLTKSIDAAFAASPIFFDICANIEYT
jgi:hypothetical protein